MSGVHIAALMVGCVAAAIALVPIGAEAADIPVPRACATAIDAQLPGWQPAPPPAHMPAAERQKRTTNVAQADFDDDGRRDTAILLRVDGKEGQSYVAVCRSTGTGVRLHLITDPYCRDGINIVPKGTRVRDIETGKMVTYRTDGVHAYCYEVAGGTYVFENNGFRLVVDSD